MKYLKLFIFIVLCNGLVAGFTGCNFPPTGPICMGNYLVGSVPDWTCPGGECPPWLSVSNWFLQVELSELSECEKITGSLLINDSNLTNFEGLDSLTSVGGAMGIFENTALASLSGLENITYVGGQLSIQNNVVLPTCEAEWLRDNIGVENIGGTIDISYNCNACTCP